MWSKGQLVDDAFGEIALANSTFDIDPDERQMALRRLEAMMATWEGKGIRIGYAFAPDPSSIDASQPSGLQDTAVETVFLNLAKRLAAGFGKQLLPSTLSNAKEGYDTLLWAAAMPAEQQLPNTLPRGAGNKPWRLNDRPFMPRPDPSPLGNTPGGDLDILE
jgi:P22 tail accessory factor